MYITLYLCYRKMIQAQSIAWQNVNFMVLNFMFDVPFKI